uniref:Uncharacterized protein n=1 Tax=candidate division WOR-3 bacterium TaxID=2052148 RepID=A0A7C4XC72_UNCW3
MEEVLELLVRIKDLDEEIKNNENQLNGIPALILKLQREIEKANNQLNQKKARIQEIKKVYKIKDGDIAENQTKIEKLNQQMHSVKTNEEYRAIVKEIEYLKNTNHKIEDEMIQLLEEEERLKNEIAKLERETNEIITKKNKEIEELKKKEVSLKERQKIARLTYQDQVNKLPNDIKVIYERVSKVRDRAICIITDEGVCTGCFFNLTPQTMNELKQKSHLILCDNCGRILIYGQ